MITRIATVHVLPRSPVQPPWRISRPSGQTYFQLFRITTPKRTILLGIWHKKWKSERD